MIKTAKRISTMKVRSLLLFSAFTSLSLQVAANVEIQFVESAPKDRFVVVNNTGCELQNFVLKFDLATTRGKLIFDTTAKGAGVEVFQPFEKREGQLSLVNHAVEDGDKALSIKVDSLPSKQQLSFTIDVDDTLTNSELGQIRVTGGEMEGGIITFTPQGESASAGVFNAQFDNKNFASISESICEA